MQRASAERRRTIRVWKIHLAQHRQFGGENALFKCPCEFQAGRFRKGQRRGGCGRARCTSATVKNY